MYESSLLQAALATRRSDVPVATYARGTRGLLLANNWHPAVIPTCTTAQ